MEWQDYQAHEHTDGAPHGALRVLRGLESPQLSNTRDIFIYLPPTYWTETNRRYPVIYMHDGQNLFDARTSFAGEWMVDETIDRASTRGMDTIVVGISNNADRLHEYSPFDDPKHGNGKGDAYLDFIIDTLKPIVDADFRTKPDRGCTGIAGSSMGGLISLYAFFKRNDVFGFAGVMSPALWFGKRGIFSFLETARYAGGRIYVDVGTREGAQELSDVKLLRDRLLELGYEHGHDMLFMVDLGAGHNEAAWARRMEKALQFLLYGQADSWEPSVPAVITTES